MSASYDNPNGRPRPGMPTPPYPEVGYDAGAYDDPVTGAPAHTAPYPPHPDARDSDASYAAAPPRATLTPDPRPEHLASGRRGKRVKSQLHAPIVPPGRVTGSSLTLVVSIMCFLACLTVGAVYLVNMSADGWLRDIASEVTVQIEPKENIDTETTAKAVADFVGNQPGVVSARILSLDDATALLEPWLGKSDALKALPVPRLIAVELDRSVAPDLDKVKSELETKFQGATLDDHRQWQRQIRTVTRSLALGGIAILALVAAATTAIIVSATKSSMASNREIVEVLHFVGATDRFIAHEFEKHFLRLGIRAGLIGAICAAVVFVAMPAVTTLLGGGPIASAELHRLIGSGSLDIAGFVLLGIVVVIVAALCMLTSRFGVYRILNQRK